MAKALKQETIEKRIKELEMNTNKGTESSNLEFEARTLVKRLNFDEESVSFKLEDLRNDAFEIFSFFGGIIAILKDRVK